MALATGISRALGSNSSAAWPGPGCTRLTVGGRLTSTTICTAVLFWACLGLLAQTNQVPPESADVGTGSASAQKVFRNAQTRYNKEPGNSLAAWQFGRACFDLAEFATRNGERAGLAEQGIAASRKALARDSNSAPAHYYLGMNLGQLARTKSLGALKLVGQMEREFISARKLDDHFDYGGPDRSLGLLYLDAPTIGSVGSRSKARQHLQRAVELAPDYPENRLGLIEAYLKWGEREAAGRQLKAIEEVWPGARGEFVGAAWVASWADWEARLKKARKKCEDPHRILESPRH